MSLTLGQWAGGRRNASPESNAFDQRCEAFFASAIRCDAPLNCGAEKASHPASWTIGANEAFRTGAILNIP